MSGAEAAGEPRKRWDQFGRYRVNTQQCENLEREVDGKPIAIPFGDDGRRLCLPANALTLCMRKDGALIAMAINKDLGLFAPMDSEAARCLANNLLRLADHMDAAQ